MAQQILNDNERQKHYYDCAQADLERMKQERMSLVKDVELMRVEFGKTNQAMLEKEQRMIIELTEQQAQYHQAMQNSDDKSAQLASSVQHIQALENHFKHHSEIAGDS